MNNSRPKVSVCLPSYNCEKFVGQAIESVLNQTVQDFELIISDDGSTDSTIKVIRNYDDPRISVFENKKNQGMEVNWNKTIKEASGQFIKLLCNDDILYPTCLERQLEIFENPLNDSIVLVSCKRDIIDSDGKKMFKRGQKLSGKLCGKEAIRKTIRTGTNVIGEPTAVMFRAELLSSVGLFDQSIPYLIDLDMWSRLLLKGDVYIIPESLCVFRVSNVSASVGMAKSQSKDFSDLIEKISDNPDYKLSSSDKIKGKMMARINSLMRQAFYKIVVNTKNSNGKAVN